MYTHTFISVSYSMFKFYVPFYFLLRTPCIPQYCVFFLCSIPFSILCPFPILCPFLYSVLCSILNLVLCSILSSIP